MEGVVEEYFAVSQSTVENQPVKRQTNWGSKKSRAEGHQVVRTHLAQRRCGAVGVGRRHQRILCSMAVVERYANVAIARANVAALLEPIESGGEIRKDRRKPHVGGKEKERCGGGEKCR